MTRSNRADKASQKVLVIERPKGYRVRFFSGAGARCSIALVMSSFGRSLDDLEPIQRQSFLPPAYYASLSLASEVDQHATDCCHYHPGCSIRE